MCLSLEWFFWPVTIFEMFNFNISKIVTGQKNNCSHKHDIIFHNLSRNLEKFFCSFRRTRQNKRRWFGPYQRLYLKIRVIWLVNTRICDDKVLRHTRFINRYVFMTAVLLEALHRSHNIFFLLRLSYIYRVTIYFDQVGMKLFTIFTVGFVFLNVNCANDRPEA